VAMDRVSNCALNGVKIMHLGAVLDELWTGNEFCQPFSSFVPMPLSSYSTILIQHCLRNTHTIPATFPPHILPLFRHLFRLISASFTATFSGSFSSLFPPPLPPLFPAHFRHIFRHIFVTFFVIFCLILISPGEAD
jgi:hypothetical protein